MVVVDAGGQVRNAAMAPHCIENQPGFAFRWNWPWGVFYKLFVCPSRARGNGSSECNGTEHAGWCRICNPCARYSRILKVLDTRCLGPFVGGSSLSPLLDCVVSIATIGLL